MKSWFPFTDYDFYAYLVSGMLLIAAVDYSLTGGVLVNRPSWTLVDGVFWGAVAYMAGQIMAAPSAALLEHVVARRWMTSPAEVQLGIVERNRFERVFAALFAPREYSPLSAPVRERALARAAKTLNKDVSALDGESVFQAAFHPARAVADTSSRLTVFLNQYGFSRNVAFVSLLALGLLIVRQWRAPSQEAWWLMLGAAVLAVGMFGRFIKFYAAYSCDVLRTYGTQFPEEKAP
jgi:hypothetical protein